MDTSAFFRYDPKGVHDDDVVFLEGCSERDWERLIDCGQRHTFRRGEVVVEIGEVDRAFFVVLQGELSAVTGAGRKRRRLSTAPAGSVIGEISFIDGFAHPASIVADSDGELLRVGFEDLELLFQHHPPLAYRILLDLARMLALDLRRATGTLPTQEVT